MPSLLIEAESELVTPFDTEPLADACTDPVAFEGEPSPEELNDPFDTEPLTDAEPEEESDRTIDSVTILETDTELLIDLDSRGELLAEAIHVGCIVSTAELEPGRLADTDSLVDTDTEGEGVTLPEGHGLRESDFDGDSVLLWEAVTDRDLVGEPLLL